MKIRSFTGALFLFLPAISWAATEVVSLRFEDLPQLIKDKNQHVSSAQSLTVAADKATGYLFRSYLPSLRVVAGAENFKTGPRADVSQPYGAVEAQVNVFRGGRDSLEDSIRESKLDQAKARYSQVFIDEVNKAREAYWHLAYNNEMLQFLEDGLDQNGKNLARAKKRLGAGLGTSTDRKEFEIISIQLEQDLARWKLGATTSARTLAAILGMAPESNIALAGKLSHDHDDKLSNVSFPANEHRDVKSLSATSEQYRLERSKFRRWWAPSVDVYAGYSLYTFQERDLPATKDRFETSVGARLTFELFDGMTSLNAASVSSAEAFAYEAATSQTARELTAAFTNAKQELQLNHSLVHGAEKNVVLAKEYLTSTLSEYDRGLKNSPDVAGASLRYIETRKRLAEVQRDYQLTRSRLLALLGS